MLVLDQKFEFRGDKVAWGRIGHGPPLVMVHGTPFSAQVWRRIAPWLASHYTVYFFDLLGYGQSTMRVGQDVSLGVQNKLFAALLKGWKLEQPSVLAHDFGGATVLRAHYLNGCKYQRLVLIDPVALAPWGSPFVQHVRKHEQAFSGLPAYAHRGLLKSYLAGAAFTPLTPEAEDIYTQPWTTEQGQAAFYRQIGQMDQKYTDEIEPLFAPPNFDVTLLWGHEDQWISYETGKRLAEKLTKGQIITVKGAGHLVQEDAPEAIVAAMLSPHD